MFISDLRLYVETFKESPFLYLVSFYSGTLWLLLLTNLFRPQFLLRREYLLTSIEQNYRPLRADYVVLVKDFAPPTVFVELARDHLINVSLNHKDEGKIAYMMGSSLSKLLWLNRSKGQEFLKKLRVFGILGGATDFDLCQMYAVFPSVANDRDFYFVFDSSKTRLRFKMLEFNDFSAGQAFTTEDDFVPCDMIEYNYPPLESPAVRISAVDENNLDEIINTEIFNEFEQDEEIEQDEEQSQQPSPNINKRYCERILKEGHVNDHALKVLEKLSDLVQKQALLLEDMEDDTDPSFPPYKYDQSRVNLMVQSRQSSSGPSPNAKKTRQADATNNVDNSPTKPRRTSPRVLKSLLDLITELKDKENRKSDFDDGNIEFRGKDSVLSDLKTICVTKDASKYEIDIYKTIKESPCFPQYFGHIELPENKIELKLEQVIPGYHPEKYYKQTRSDLFGAKILVDLLGALITLHSAGFVHGDISPANIGYNNSRGIWQLFDFDNSRPIKEAAEGIGKFHVTEKFVSKKYMESGIYYPFDDFVGLMKSLHEIFDFIFYKLKTEIKDIMNQFEGDDILDVLKLQKIYYDATNILWDQIKDSSDPSIKNAAVIIGKFM